MVKLVFVTLTHSPRPLKALKVIHIRLALILQIDRLFFILAQKKLMKKENNKISLKVVGCFSASVWFANLVLTLNQQMALQFFVFWENGFPMN